MEIKGYGQRALLNINVWIADLLLEDDIGRGRVGGGNLLRMVGRVGRVPQHSVLLRLQSQVALSSAGRVAPSLGARQHQRSRPVRLWKFIETWNIFKNAFQT